ncbi:hypothetical protein LXA43DRAFT_1066921 [Ganoderma leucocontextum]|nr:hypothetical protein LXA43DRAFT_1066921 [Ganoderma leucocontextum]
MPSLAITPESALSFLPARGNPDRFDYILGLVRNHVAQPLVREDAPFAVQADNVYTAENITCPWDPTHPVDVFVMSDADMVVADRIRYGHAVLFFEDVVPAAPGLPRPSAPLPPPAPTSTPEGLELAAPIPSYYIPPPPTPPMIGGLLHQGEPVDLTPHTLPVRDVAGEYTDVRKATVIALTEALVCILAQLAMISPPPYATVEVSREITYEQMEVSKAADNEAENNDSLKGMELKYPSSPKPEPEPIPGLISAITTTDEDQERAVETATIGNTTDTEYNATDDEMDELTEYSTPRYDFRPRGMRSYYESPPPRTRRTCRGAGKSSFPNRANLALQADEAAGLELLLARPPKYWTKKDRLFMKTVMRSLRRAMVGGLGMARPRAPTSAAPSEEQEVPWPTGRVYDSVRVSAPVRVRVAVEVPCPRISRS